MKVLINHWLLKKPIHAYHATCVEDLPEISSCTYFTIPQVKVGTIAYIIPKTPEALNTLLQPYEDDALPYLDEEAARDYVSGCPEITKFNMAKAALTCEKLIARWVAKRLENASAFAPKYKYTLLEIKRFLNA